MKQFIFFLFLALAFGDVAAQKKNANQPKPIELKNIYDSAGYAMGVDVGSSLKSRKMNNLNRKLMRTALEDYIAGNASLIDENDCFMLLNEYSNKMMSGDTTAVAVVKPEEKKKAPASKKTKAIVEEIKLGNLADSAGYALGINIASSLKMQDITAINRELIYAAMECVFKGDSLLIHPDAAYGVMNTFVQRLAREKAAAIIKAGEDFLAENAKRPEVKTTASGLQYEVITEGTGEKLTANDIFICHYRGTLIDGTEFDASYNRNQPLEYGVSRVIKGWTEGLQLMPVGSKYKFYIPYQLGYGVNGAPPAIPGGSALIFEVELLGFKKQ